MRARALGVALVVIASACGSKQDGPLAGSSGSASGSGAAGSSAASDPWNKPAAPAADAAEAPCDDAEIRQHIAASFAASRLYMEALDKKASKWGKDCEAVKKDLLALAPDAEKFMAAQMPVMTWMRELTPSCMKRVKEIGEAMPEADALDKRLDVLGKTQIAPALERCKDHPGLQEAAAKGLRIPRKKRD